VKPQGRRQPSRIAAQLVVLAIVAILFFAVVRSFVIPVVVGFLISLVLHPMYNWLTVRLNGRKRLAAAISTTLLTLCVIVPLTLLAMSAVKEGAAVVKELSHVAAENTQQDRTMMDIRVINSIYLAVSKLYPVTAEEYLSTLKSFLKQAGAVGAGVLGRIAAGVPGKLLSLIFFLIAFYFGLVDGPRLADFARKSSPFSSGNTDRLFHAVEQVSYGVVIGAMLSGLLHGIIIGSAYWILGIPRPLFFGALTFILSFVPMVGSAPTGYGGVLYLLIIGRGGAAIVMLVAALTSSISDNIVKPWVLKGKMDLHPLLGLISALGGIELFGFSGVFLGPLIAALAIELVQIMPEKKTAPQNP
jgi:predicted PurR-regulated permease PerM